MYELKTKETENSVIEFIEMVDNLKKREDAYKLLDIFTKNKSGKPLFLNMGMNRFLI